VRLVLGARQRVAFAVHPIESARQRLWHTAKAVFPVVCRGQHRPSPPALPIIHSLSLSHTSTATAAATVVAQFHLQAHGVVSDAISPLYVDVSQRHTSTKNDLHLRPLSAAKELELHLLTSIIRCLYRRRHRLIRCPSSSLRPHSFPSD
jgi:hypothetical protein